MKIKNFIKTHKEYFITSAIIFAIVFLSYALLGLFPLGKNSIAYYDMIAQTIPQSDLIFDYLKGEKSWFYSTSTGMGANTFGYIIYFILSPFNLLTLIAGESNQFYTVNIVFLLKLICIGCMAVWFIKKYFTKLNLITIISLSLMYTFCGYMFFNWTYLSFLDYLIYAPLFVYFFTLLKDKNKILPLSILITFMILSCFSLGCFHLLYLVAILIGYVFICVEKTDRRRLLMKLISACFIGVGLTMWLMVPALIQYLNSGRGTVSQLTNAPIFYGLATRIAVAITELVSVFFATLFIIKCNKKDKFNQFLIYTSILVLITIIFDEVMYMLNGGSLLGYYSRFGSSGALLTLTLACKYFNDIFKINEDPKKYKFNIITNYITSIGLMVVVLFAIFLKIDEFSQVFVGQYMTYEGLFIYLLVILVIALILSFALITKNMIGKHFYNIVLISSLFVCCFNFPLQLYDATFDINIIKTNQNLTTNIKDDYRVKFLTSSYLCYNAPTLNVNSINTFSSMIDNSVPNSLYYLGYPASGTTAHSYGGTILSDLLVGNKYVISEWPIEKNYLKLIDNNDTYYLYENIYFSDYITAFDSEITFTDDFIENQETIYQTLGGEGKLFEQINFNDLEFTYDNCEYNEDLMYFTYNNVYDNPTITIKDTFDKNTLLYVEIDHEDFNSIPIEIYGNRLISNCLIEINNFTSDYTFKFLKELDLSSYKFYTLDINKIASLNLNSYSLEEGKNNFKTTINLDKDSSVLIPFADIAGYTVKVNGQETEFTNAFNGLMTLDLKSGENIVEIEFKNPLFDYFIKGILIGIIFVLIGVLVYRLRDDINDKFINISFNGLSIIYLFVFILVPIVICFMKIFKFL